MFYHPVVSDSATPWTAVHQASLSFRLNLKPPQKSIEDPHTDMTGPCSRLSSLKDHNRWTSTPCSIQPRPNLCRRWSKSRSRQSLSSISWVQLPRGLLDAQERAGTGSSRAHELVPLPGHHLSQPSRGGGPGCPTGPQGPQKRGHWRKTADRRAVSVEGQSHHTPPTTPVLIL